MNCPRATPCKLARILLNTLVVFDMEIKEWALVVNFGGQYTHLISRRLRQVGIYTKVLDYDRIEPRDVEGAKLVVLSGGPSSVLEENSPRVGKWLFEYDKPILGICYGHQLIAEMLGGKVSRGAGEYGRTKIFLLEYDQVFSGWDREEYVWMSHNDYVEEPPKDFKVLAVSENGYIAAMRHVEKPIYSVQFHPEVSHTPKGLLLLENFVYGVAKASYRWRPESQVEGIVEELRRTIPEGEEVVVGVSGGIDSTVTTILLRRALGDRVLPVLIDHGLFREGEVEEVIRTFKRLGIEVLYVDASELFLSRLEGVSDCEEKRRIVGETFAEIFMEIARRRPSIRWLGQGTLYPDVIESGLSRGASRIKSHHNVAGLPPWFNLKVVEPLKYFYKDEVRRIAISLGLPPEIVKRHPFPGPGLAVRIIGTFNRRKLEVVRRAQRIVEEELRRAGLYERVWQAFAVVGDDTWVGVKGDSRAQGYIVTVRIVESEDAMTADWSRLDPELLDRISRRITNEIPDVTMVTYAITSKPPSTIEPC